MVEDTVLATRRRIRDLTESAAVAPLPARRLCSTDSASHSQRLDKMEDIIIMRLLAPHRYPPQSTIIFVSFVYKRRPGRVLRTQPAKVRTPSVWTI